jgi:hypothetical protein
MNEPVVRLIAIRLIAVQLAVVLVAAAAMPALAQPTLWRCGPDGRAFSDRPCPDGRTLTIAETSPTPAARAEAHAVAARERVALRMLTEQRLARQADAVTVPAGITVGSTTRVAVAEPPRAAVRRARTAGPLAPDGGRSRHDARRR